MAPPFSNSVGNVLVEQETDTQRTLEYVSDSGVADVVWPRVVNFVSTRTVRPVFVVDNTVQGAEGQLTNKFTSYFSTCRFC